MDARIKILIGSLIGGGLGYIAGRLIVEHLYPEFEEEWVQEEVEFEKIEQEKENLTVTRRPRKISKSVAPMRDYAEYYKSQNRPDLAALARKYNGDGEEPESQEQRVEENVWVYEEPIEEKIQDISEDLDPSIVSLAEYAMNNEGFRKMILNYYDDDVLTDQDEVPVPNPDIIVGTEALVSFGVLSQDPDTVYVRNQKLRGYYEIIRTNASYAPEPEALVKRSIRVQKAKEEDDQ